MGSPRTIDPPRNRVSPVAQLLLMRMIRIVNGAFAVWDSQRRSDISTAVDLMGP